MNTKENISFYLCFFFQLFYSDICLHQNWRQILNFELEYLHIYERYKLCIINLLHEGQKVDNFDMNNIMNGVWTPAEVAQICTNHRESIELAMKKIYERKAIPEKE